MNTVDLRYGDCLAVLRELPDESVSAVITDPPYGLSEIKSERLIAALTAWASGDRDHVPDARGFMGATWDAFVPPPAVWDECLRVLKPGGHLAAFAGSRTYDLMGMSIRLAGFEIRDGLQWLYGSGFPKSLDVSKAIDKQRDDKPAILHVTAFVRAARDRAGLRNADVDAALGVTAMCDHWCRSSPLQAQVPTWEQWEKLRDLLGFGDEMDAEVWRLNGRKGTPGEAWAQREVIGRTVTPFKVDKAVDRVSSYDPTGSNITAEGYRYTEHTAPTLPAAEQWQGWGTALKPAVEPIVLARKPLAGTVAANVLAHGTGALNVDACRVATSDDTGRTRNTALGIMNDDGWKPTPGYTEKHAAGRWPANVLLTHAPECHEPGECAPGCPVAELDAQSGTTGAHGSSRGAVGENASPNGITGPRGRVAGGGHGDEGGASRFFPSFRYQAKAPTSERPKIDGKGWPTVKPQGLMRWLVRLLTPPGGIVLDPFAGTGSTLQAARDEGFASIGIERDEFAYLLACQRLGLPEVVPATVTDAETGEPVSLVPEPEPEPEPVDPALAAIAKAESYDDLIAIYVEHKAEWTDERTAAAAARRAEIEGAAA